VRKALRVAGVQPYVWADGLERFYTETDAFLYELVAWNRNRIKEQMRRSVGKYIARLGPAARVLSIGDGLGFDSADLAGRGHAVTYFELPGLTERFARRVFDAVGAEIEVRTRVEDIERGAFDAVVCLDVLEHVLDPPGFVRTLGSYLRIGGLLLTHAPFMIVQPSCSTHLRANRRFSGDVTLYERNGFRIVDGELGWNPLVSEKREGSLSFSRRWRPKQWLLRIAPCVMGLGRTSASPFFWADRLRMLNDRRFES
jgi:SAM-dependent methyltransferase